MNSDAVTLGVHHVGLTVDSVERCADFFLRELGFSKVAEKPEYPAIFVSDGTTMLTLWQAREPKSCREFDRKNALGLHHLALRLPGNAELKLLHVRLEELAEVVVEFAPEAVGVGAQHMMCLIPGGIRVEFIAVAESGQ